MSLAIAKKGLEPEQAAAAYEIDKHVSVTAGPGSGKTTVLVERYLHILSEREPSIDQIVAITFTNRAANEMRERLRTRVHQLLQTATGKQRRRWLAYKRTLDGAVITTIHGFCARLLREFPVEASIDPHFQLLDEHRAAMLLESVVEETVSEFIGSGHSEISRLTLGVGRGRLVAALARIYRDARGQGLCFADLARKTANSHATEDDYARALLEVTRAMDDFRTVRRITPDQIASSANVSSTWLKLRSSFEMVPPIENLADYCRSVESFQAVRPDARGHIANSVKALDQLIWGKNLQGRVPQICLDLFARQYALEMVNMLSRIDERLGEEKQSLSALDFDDLELRALDLLNRPAVLTRSSERYRFFLVDEFQDTNGLQKRLLERMALSEGRRENANLFIVGDRKQSIYGFRGADVDVFSEITGTLIENGGESKSLSLNFRSQPPLVNFFNHLFGRLFKPGPEISRDELNELGYVPHENSTARRGSKDPQPLVELMITTTTDSTSSAEDDPKAEQTTRELDAAQLAHRINQLIDQGQATYGQIALLFRAMTDVQTYESVFRRANIPYQTVLGRGFYEREEVTDLIQLLRFLDNKTDELALAAILRSPLCGISDNALLALRCAPHLDELDGPDPLRRFSRTRKLLSALRRHREIAFISEDEHKLLDRATRLIDELIARRHHYNIGDLLRFAVDRSEYMTVVAANFDGPQRLANVHRLFSLAERFERSGSHLIRDFVRYVREFEEIGSRESEGQIDEAANSVRLMTIHQAKGLQFPVVVIPDLQRSSKPLDDWVLLDRHRGLTLKVPDGRGKQVAGCTFTNLAARQAWREQFEGMRLLYVAATRAEDRLILSGTAADLDKLNGKSDTWLKWIWRSLELTGQRQSGIVDLAADTQIQLTLNISAAETPAQPGDGREDPDYPEDSEASLDKVFPLLRPITVDRQQAIQRFSVTQLINYQRCPRQYYFDRVLHVPSADQLAVWNDAEAPEPPANLTATLKGAVIHRFCERHKRGDDPRVGVRASLNEILRQRRAELADRLVEIDIETAVAELLPLAENYVASKVFQRIEVARSNTNNSHIVRPTGKPGLWNELTFRLRRPLGVLTGTLDKLLVTLQSDELSIEIIDFKTNRIRSVNHDRKDAAGWDRGRPARRALPNNTSNCEGPAGGTPLVPSKNNARVERGNQMPLDFVETTVDIEPMDQPAVSANELVSEVARDYQLQMQAYALAVRQLLPSWSGNLKVTLHFLEPNIEFRLPNNLLEAEVCARAIDQAMEQIVSSLEPEHFPVKPAQHCRMCSFVGICPAGLRQVSRSNSL